MLSQNSENLNFIVKDKNLLIFGKNELHHLNAIFSKFNTLLVEEITDYTLQNLNTTISKNSIDVIIINSNAFQKDMYEKLFELCEYENLCILLCKGEQNDLCDDLINLSDSVFTPKINQKLFTNKIYHCIQNQITNIDEVLNSKDTYVDSVEIEIIFIRDELLYIVKQIDNGDISPSILSKIIQSLKRISKIYEHYLIYSQKVKNSIKSFEDILQSIDLNDIDSKNVESFDYLARIVEDIAMFLDNYFIKRSFDDLYVVEDSMENSLKFLKASFEHKDSRKDGSSLEFFDD